LEIALDRSTITTLDLDRLRDIVDVANDAVGRPAVDLTFAVLDGVRDAIGADWATLQDMHASAPRIRHLQCATGGEYEIVGSEFDANDPADPFWTHYPHSACSIPDRAGKPIVFSLREVYTEREWARHPMHREVLTDIRDELMSAWPCGPDANLRLMLARTEGPPFDDRDRFLLQLLRPHLQPLFLEAMRSATGDAEPPLTQRQRQILVLVRSGMTNQQVARQLGISPATVRKHLENSYGRLHVQSRTAAVDAAFAYGTASLQQV
jgi:DNA-binding CsgD family transcriptional regulator